MTRFYIVVDLGFGDAGKGSLVDYLAQTRNASAIIRYTGGPQAAHHVVSRAGVSHAFCQFGSTFTPTVQSHLARPLIVKPENLIYEESALRSKGVTDPCTRLSINPGCRIVTSFHAMLGQMKELARGDKRLGTVGIGVGEAVRDSERDAENALRVRDLFEPKALKGKLAAHYENKCREAEQLIQECTDVDTRCELQELFSVFTTEVKLAEVEARYRFFAHELPITYASDADRLCQFLQSPGPILCEGAHATLLDYEYGYFPYVTKTDTSIHPALAILDQAGIQEKAAVEDATVIGVVRAMGYRHGPGPFVSEDPQLKPFFQEPHNRDNEWQGATRYGWFDLVAIRHALRINRKVDAIALTMVDHLARFERCKICLSYEYVGQNRELLDKYFCWDLYQTTRVRITDLKRTPNHKSDELSRLLFECVPLEWIEFKNQSRGSSRFKNIPGIPDCLEDLIRFLESREGLDLPVRIISYGPTAREKIELG